VKFLGYTMNEAGPEFRYRAGDVEVREQALPRKGAPGLTLRVRIASTKAVYYFPSIDPNAQWTSDVGVWQGGMLALTPVQAADFTLTLSSALCTTP
jgi:hypothetical protein